MIDIPMLTKAAPREVRLFNDWFFLPGRPPFIARIAGGGDAAAARRCGGGQGLRRGGAGRGGAGTRRERGGRGRARRFTQTTSSADIGTQLKCQDCRNNGKP